MDELKVAHKYFSSPYHLISNEQALHRHADCNKSSKLKDNMLFLHAL